MASTCNHCRTQVATIHVTGPKLPRGTNVCERCYPAALRAAGETWCATLIHDDGQDTLFDLGGTA